MTSILKTDEIQSQNGNSVIDVANGTLKHPSASGNNIALASDGSATATLSSTSVVPASVGSSLVLVKSSQGFTVDNDATTSSAYIENCFNSTYRDYLVYITGTIGTTEGNLSFRYGNSSGRNSVGNYFFVIRAYDSSNTPRLNSGSNSSSSLLMDAAKGGASDLFDRFAIQIKIHNPQASGGISYTGTCSYPRSGVAFYVNYIGGTYRQDDFSATNMQFYFSAGSGTFNFQSYGIKTS